MPDMGSVALVVALVLAGALLLGVWVLVRRVVLGIDGRVFDAALRGPHDERFSVGLARFRTDRLEWFRIIGLSLRPAHTFRRGETWLVRFRPPTDEERTELDPDFFVAQLEGTHRGSLLAMTRGDLTALSSWTEAAPPGMEPRRP